MSTIAAISTPNAAGGIGIVKISGPDAISIADKVFACAGNKKLQELPGYSAKFGRVHDGDNILDQAIAIIYRAPKSYTGEDVVELQCHGGLYLMQQILRLCLKNGASPAEPGEFTKRAFLNGKMDLSEAESVMTLISAHGRQAADAAFSVLSGSLSKEIEEVKSVFVSAAAHMSAWVDYPDDEIPELDFDSLKVQFKEAKEKLLKLINKYDAGQAITEGVETVIVGKPNVGKSTLMNLLLGRERSIVTEVAGTTRDVVEETARIGNVVLRLSDTAGIRESTDVVESIGIEYAKTKLSHSALILAVVDSSSPLDEEDIKILEACKGKPSICILNKTDLGKTVTPEMVKEYVSDVVTLSAKDSNSFDILRVSLETLLGTANFDSSAALLINERQLNCCQKAVGYIDEAICAIEQGLTMDAVNVSVDATIEPLLELTGERVSDAVVGEVFSKFCVGK